MNPETEYYLEKGDVASFLLASVEEAGQAALVKKQSKLPKKALHGTTWEMLKSLGIEVLGDDGPRDIFYNVKLPVGWKIKKSDHSMWTYLHDDKDRRRGAIFFKAASYDYDAHISLDNRFGYMTQPVGGGYTKDYEADLKKPVSGIVQDRALDNKIIWETTDTARRDNYKSVDDLADQAKAWLETNYPDYKNPLAYWD